MESYVSIPQILLLVALLSAGTILFLVVRKVIEQMDIFRGRWASVTAFSISCLIVASIAMLLMVPSSAAENGYMRQIRVNFSLLPGVAVAGTIILLQLFVIAAATAPNKTNEVPVRETVHKSAQPKSPGRPKKEKPAKKESKEVAKPVGSST
jgi:hypothetical protein